MKISRQLLEQIRLHILNHPHVCTAIWILGVLGVGVFVGGGGGG